MSGVLQCIPPLCILCVSAVKQTSFWSNRWTFYAGSTHFEEPIIAPAPATLGQS